MISGLWMLVIFASLLLIMGCYERAYDTALCCEAAVYGGTESISRTGDGVEKARERLSADKKTYAASGNKKEISVTFTNKVELPFENLMWKWKRILKSKVIKPVLFIEEIQKIRRFRNSMMD